MRLMPLFFSPMPSARTPASRSASADLRLMISFRSAPVAYVRRNSIRRVGASTQLFAFCICFVARRSARTVAESRCREETSAVLGLAGQACGLREYFIAARKVTTVEGSGACHAGSQLGGRVAETSRNMLLSQLC